MDDGLDSINSRIIDILSSDLCNRSKSGKYEYFSCTKKYEEEEEEEDLRIISRRKEILKNIEKQISVFESHSFMEGRRSSLIKEIEGISWYLNRISPIISTSKHCDFTFPFFVSLIFSIKSCKKERSSGFSLVISW